MTCQTLLLLAALNPGSTPAEPTMRSRETGLNGIWTLMYVEWMGERTDQAVSYSELDPKLGTRIYLEGRWRIRFDSEKMTCFGGPLGRPWEPDWAEKQDYSLHALNGRTILRTSLAESLIAVAEDTLYLCHHQGWNRLPRAIGSDVNDPDVVLLVYRRGDFSRRVLSIERKTGA